jgi:6-pyruvoyltetrahydropterin/6-carboxytetrahydropterin synthase
VIVATEYDFDAAHNLPRYAGKCERLHGHTYRLRVLCEAPVDPSTGLAIDFAEVRRVVRTRVVDVLDHTYLNETIPVPSAENIAIWIWDRLGGSGLPLQEIQVFETPGCFVIYRGEGPAGRTAPKA